MKTKKTKSLMPIVDAARIAKIVGLILVVPTMGNLTAAGWNWGLSDFVVAAVLLFSSGVALEYTAKRIVHPTYRVLACCAIVATLLVVWVELAAGIFY